MSSVLAYILESSIICSLFYFFYKTAYYGLTYYRWERYFLIFSVLAAFVLPFLKVEYHLVEIPIKMQIVNLDFNEGGESITIETEKTLLKALKNFFYGNEWNVFIKVLTIVYVLGFIFKTIMFLGAIKKINGFKKNPIKLENAIVYQTDLNTVAFSFFDSIFVNKEFNALSHDEKQTVITHEKTHIADYHSVDTVIFGLLGCIHWFNPLVKKMAAAVRQVCENIVDAKTSINGGAKHYSQLMLKLGKVNGKLIDRKYVEPSNLKKRIIAVFSMDSSKLRKARFLFSLPILILSIAAYIMLSGLISVGGGGKKDFFLQSSDYSVTARYFENKIFIDSLGNVFNVSHRELNLKTLKPCDAVATMPLLVESCDTSDYKGMRCISCNFWDGEQSIIIGGFEQLLVTVGDTLQVGTLIGRLGDGKLPISVKVKKNDVIINPESLFYFY